MALMALMAHTFPETHLNRNPSTPRTASLGYAPAFMTEKAQKHRILQKTEASTTHTRRYANLRAHEAAEKRRPTEGRRTRPPPRSMVLAAQQPKGQDSQINIEGPVPSPRFHIPGAQNQPAAYRETVYI
jgi:hypothetical protein